MSTGNIGYGLLILLVVFTFVFSLDKIIRFVTYLIDRLEEQKRNKKKL
jgi:hypothetical protein